jgi:esterase/lipase superfamily enzyme
MAARLRVSLLITCLAVFIGIIGVGCSNKKPASQSTTSASSQPPAEGQPAPSPQPTPPSAQTQPPPPPPATSAAGEGSRSGSIHHGAKARPPAASERPTATDSSSSSASAGSSSSSSSSATASAPPPPPDGTRAPDEMRAGEHTTAAAAPDGGNYKVVRVFYATDRARTGISSASKFYGVDRQSGEKLHLGTLDVSIPRDHRMGRMERPSILRLEFREDPSRHVMLLSVTPKSEAEFYQELANKVGTSPNKDAFVFIHGFDNSFEQAAWRTAQLAYDLNFAGAPILYSWPSKAKLTAYAADEATVDWTVPHLEKFLETVAVETHATTVHLIAHSMGNRALTRALVNIASRHSGVPPMFRQVFLAAPDIDIDVFRQLAATFPSAAAHVTLYASSRDEALAASARVHSQFRAGDARHICVVPHVDTIDASAVDTSLLGHAYYGDNRSILSDIYQVIQSGAPPGQRFGMHSMMFEQSEYWAFQP